MLPKPLKVSLGRIQRGLRSHRLNARMPIGAPQSTPSLGIVWMATDRGLQRFNGLAKMPLRKPDLPLG
ncbi:MAG: hypothetical protein ACPGUF_03150 [Litorivicinus sp.]